jgi:hypothetical protein
MSEKGIQKQIITVGVDGAIENSYMALCPTLDSAIQLGAHVNDTITALTAKYGCYFEPQSTPDYLHITIRGGKPEWGSIGKFTLDHLNAAAAIVDKQLPIQIGGINILWGESAKRFFVAVEVIKDISLKEAYQQMGIVDFSKVKVHFTIGSLDPKVSVIEFDPNSLKAPGQRYVSKAALLPYETEIFEDIPLPTDSITVRLGWVHFAPFSPLDYKTPIANKQNFFSEARLALLTWVAEKDNQFQDTITEEYPGDEDSNMQGEEIDLSGDVVDTGN